MAGFEILCVQVLAGARRRGSVGREVDEEPSSGAPLFLSLQVELSLRMLRASTEK